MGRVYLGRDVKYAWHLCWNREHTKKIERRGMERRVVATKDADGKR